MDRGRYFILTNWLIFLNVAIGVQTVFLGRFRLLRLGSFRQSLSLVVAALCLFFPYYLSDSMWHTGDWGDMHNEHDSTIFAKGVFDAVKPNAVIVSWWGASTSMWYAHYVIGLRPDVEIIDDSQAEPNGWKDLTDAIDLYYGARPVYAVSFPDELERYGKKYKFNTVAKLAWFGMAVNEVVGVQQSK